LRSRSSRVPIVVAGVRRRIDVCGCANRPVRGQVNGADDITPTGRLHSVHEYERRCAIALPERRGAADAALTFSGFAGFALPSLIERPSRLDGFVEGGVQSTPPARSPRM